MNTNHPPLVKAILATVSLGLMSATSGFGATVIGFNSASDLDLFNQHNNSGTSVSYWSYNATAGLNGGGGIVGLAEPASGWSNPGWAFLKAPLAGTESVSAMIHFHLSQPAVTVNGYNLYLGVAPSENFVPNITTVADPNQNYYASLLQVRANSPTSGEYQFRTISAYSNAGTFNSAGTTGNVSLDYDGWYALSLTATRDELGVYTLSTKVFSVDGLGNYTEINALASSATFSIPGLTDADNNYLFFGVPGQSVNRGILALDLLEYSAIPEPNSLALLLIGLAGLRLLSRWKK